MKGKFADWLLHKGWTIHPNKGQYEALRASKDGTWCILFSRTRSAMLTVQDENYNLVDQFFKELNK